MTVYARDLSNYTQTLTPAMLESWKADGVGLAVVQAVDPPAGYPTGKTREQVQACLDAGLVVDASVWLWFDLDESDIRHKLSLLDGLPIRQLWLDVEDAAASKYSAAECEGKVNAALALCDAYLSKPTGVYSGRWYWTDPKYMGDTTAYSDRKLWDADYDDIKDTTSGYEPYGGWATVAIKQYRGSQPDGTDLNVLSDAEAAELNGAPVNDAERKQMQDKIDGLTSALGLVAGDFMKPLTRKGAAAYVKTFVDQTRAIADQFGVGHS